MSPIVLFSQESGLVSRYIWSQLCSFSSFLFSSIIFVVFSEHACLSLSILMDLCWFLPGSHPGAPALPLLAFDYRLIERHHQHQGRWAQKHLNLCYALDCWLCLLKNCYEWLLERTLFSQVAHLSFPRVFATHRRHLFLQACWRDHLPLLHRPQAQDNLYFHPHLNLKTCCGSLAEN